MAGGTFTLSGKKVRPGTYINIKTGKVSTLGADLEGAVLLPLIGADYGPAQEFIKIDASAPDANFSKLGHSVYDNTTLMMYIREALKGCREVYVFIPAAGTKAAKTLGGVLVCTAKYGGALGNSFKVAVTANATLGTGYFNVTVYNGTEVVETFEGVQKIGDLDGVSEYIDFTAASGSTATTALVAATAAALEDGANGSMNNAAFTAMLDASESEDWNVLAFPYSSDTYSSLCTAIVSKIKYFREEAGKDVYAVMSGVAGDYEGIFNVDNGYTLTDGTDVSATEATCFIAGVTAGANYLTSNTYRKVDGAAKVLNPKTHDEAVAAINAGKIFFSYDDSWNVIVEYDINSLTTFTSTKDESYRKGRVNRVFDAYKALLRANFPPNRFDNSETGWKIMEGIGKSIHKTLQDEGAIQNVDLDNDFKVDRSRSEGDRTYFNVALWPIDSSEKLYFSITTY